MPRDRRSADDFADEIRSHLEMEADELESEGIPRSEAERQAKVAFGNSAVARKRFALSHGCCGWTTYGRMYASEFA
jgi:hypothetical protein